ncbi:MAG: hypothetical protein GF320_03695 [Armatimonadia bacterium]|jgi:hypothetical protein|nr:hypothetical protein [Armatimonadia bacterium]
MMDASGGTEGTPPGGPPAKQAPKPGLVAIIVILVLVAVGGAVWSGWNAFRNREVRVEGLPPEPDVPMNPDDPTRTKGSGPGPEADDVNSPEDDASIGS